MHIGDLDGIATVGAKDWQVTVTILVHNASHQPVSGATVYGQSTNSPGTTLKCRTGTVGTCTVTITKIPLGLSELTFGVTNATHATLTYDSTANHDPDGDSSGTKIVIPRGTQAPSSWIARLEAFFEGIVTLLLGTD
jgi:hypothetical protein